MTPAHRRERILLVRLSAVGDVINVLPALGRLRRARPEAHLTFLVEDRARELVEGHPDLDDVIVFPRRAWRASLTQPRRWPRLLAEVRAQWARLRGARFDVALDFQGNLKGALHALASGAPRRIGFARGHAKEGSHWVATECVVPPPDRPHRVEKFASLLGPLGVADSGPLTYRLPDAPGAQRAVERFLAGSTSPGRALVAIHPGTSAKGASKRWPIQRYGELAAALAAAGDVTVVVTHGPGEKAMAEEVRAGAVGLANESRPGEAGRVEPPPVILAPDGLTLLGLAALLGRAAVFVSADTGPMHLAAAVRTPCVALFGPKDPQVYRPWGLGHAVLRPAPPADPGDVSAISPDTVVREVRRVIGPPPVAGRDGLEGSGDLGYGNRAPRTR